MDLARFSELVPLDHGLCVVTTLRPDGGAHSTVVNAGVLPHPLAGTPVVGLVARGDSLKVRHLRRDPRCTIVVRAGWRWATVEGAAQLFGPDEADPEVRPEALRLLLRSVFEAAGGTHDDWDTYDRVMAEERRVAVLVTPQRTYSTPAG